MRRGAPGIKASTPSSWRGLVLCRIPWIPLRFMSSALLKTLAMQYTICCLFKAAICCSLSELIACRRLFRRTMVSGAKADGGSGAPTLEYNRAICRAATTESRQQLGMSLSLFLPHLLFQDDDSIQLAPMKMGSEEH